MPEPTPIYRWPVPLLTETVDAAQYAAWAEAVNDRIAVLKAGLDLSGQMPSVCVSGEANITTSYSNHIWDVALWDTDGMWRPSAPTVLTARRAGVMSVAVMPSFGGGASTTWVECRVLRNGAEVLRRKAHPIAVGSTFGQNKPILSGLVYVRPGDQLTVQARASASFSPNAAAVAHYMVLQGPHLNANPHFETPLDPWTPVGTTVFDRVEVPVRAGMWAARYIPDGSTSSVYASTELLAVEDPGTYSVTGWVNPSQSWGSVSMAATWFDGGGAQLGVTSGSSVAATQNTWTFVYANLPALAGAASARFHARATGTPPNTTSFRWDEVYVTRLD